jgi:hypothetical protein
MRILGSSSAISDERLILLFAQDFVLHMPPYTLVHVAVGVENVRSLWYGRSAKGELRYYLNSAIRPPSYDRAIVHDQNVRHCL